MHSIGARHSFSVALPIVLMICWPRSYGPSLEAFPLLLCALLACVTLANIRRWPSTHLSVWLSGVVALIALRGTTYAEYTLLLLPFAFSVWVAMALGATTNSERRLWDAIAYAIVAAAAINLSVAALQLFHCEASFYPFATRNGTARPYGNLRQANHFASLLAIAEVVFWWGCCERRWPIRWVGLAVMVGAWGIAISGSRTALLELVLLAVAAAAWRQPNDRRIWPLFLSLPLAAILLSWLTALLMNSLGIENASLMQRSSNVSQDPRLLHWQAALQLILQHPWTGVGWREFRWARFLDRPQDALIETAENAHDLPLQLAVELGIPAALLILLPCVLFGIAAFRRAHRKPRGRCALLILGVMLIHSLLEFPLWYLNFAFIAGVAAGIVAAPAKAQTTWSPRKISATSLIGSLIVVTALFDYDRVAAAYGSSIFSPTRDSHSALIQAQKTVLFRAYADYALVTQVPVREENALAMTKLTTRLMHLGPDPAILSAAIMARCALEEQVERLQLIRDFELAFPENYDKFVKQSGPDLQLRCGLVAIR